MAKTDLTVGEADAFELAAELADLAREDAGRGSENVSANDIAIPFISILQKMSPECDEDSSSAEWR